MPTDASPSMPSPRAALDDFRHLRSFLAICERGSVGGAAADLARPKASVARSLGELERGLGVALFERHADSLACTVHGDVVRRRAGRALREFGAGLAAMAGRRVADDKLPAFPNQLFRHDRLQAFVALAETRHMPTAAAALGVTLLKVSRSINDLERSLGTILFARTPGGAIPTAPCRAFAGHVRRTLFELGCIVPELEALERAVP